MTTTKDEAIKTLREACVAIKGEGSVPVPVLRIVMDALAATSHIAPDAAAIQADEDNDQKRLALDSLGLGAFADFLAPSKVSPAIAPEASELAPIKTWQERAAGQELNGSTTFSAMKAEIADLRAAIAMHQSASDAPAAAEPVPTDLSEALRRKADSAYQFVTIDQATLRQAADELDRLATKPAASEIEKMADDALRYGTGVMCGSKHIPVEDFYNLPAAPAAPTDAKPDDGIDHEATAKLHAILAEYPPERAGAPTDASPTPEQQINTVWDDALEEAALICDGVNNHDNPMTAGDCADAIRALKSSPQAPKTSE